ncbi:MAG: hypothetical protein DRM99_03650 [Thermoplasmata archaeon]|nr:MAG: hypothetical protein DRM99_03650 [Thermoplasmata archaeon]
MTRKRNPNTVQLTAVLNDEQLKAWKSLTKGSNRSYSDAFKLLIDVCMQTDVGKKLLEIGGFFDEIKPS